MKGRFALILCVVSSLFASCKNFFPHDYTITNSASQPVRFRLTNNIDDSVYTLAVGESMEKDLYNNPSFNLIDCPLVTYFSGKENAEFRDRDSYPCRIYNETDVDVTVTEKNNLIGKYCIYEVKIHAASYVQDENIIRHEIPSTDTALYTQYPTVIPMGSDGMAYGYELKKVYKHGSEEKYSISGVTRRCYAVGDSRFKAFGIMRVQY